MAYPTLRALLPPVAQCTRRPPRLSKHIARRNSHSTRNPFLAGTSRENATRSHGLTFGDVHLRRHLRNEGKPTRREKPHLTVFAKNERTLHRRSIGFANSFHQRLGTKGATPEKSRVSRFVSIRKHLCSFLPLPTDISIRGSICRIEPKQLKAADTRFSPFSSQLHHHSTVGWC